MHSLMRGLGDQQSHDCRFAKSLACFQTMQAFDQNEAALAGANLNGCLLSNFENTFRNLLDGLGFKRLAPLHRHVNPVDREGFRLEHSFYSKKIAKEAMMPSEQHSIGRCKIFPRCPVEKG